MGGGTRRALVSVSDKTGLAEFAAALLELGFEIVSTGGTRKFLTENHVPAIELADYTGFPEILEGRVKTLHPKVHGAILGRPDLPGDAAQIREHGIIPFELVVCNLYPFAETIARPGVTPAEAIEQIDIGGPSMIRSAAKNHAYLGVVTRPNQYQRVAAALRNGPLPAELRRELAAAAFTMTAEYDVVIALYLDRLCRPEDQQGQTHNEELLGHVADKLATQNALRQVDVPETVAGEKFPARLTLDFVRRDTLRYGENPHQQAAFYVEPAPGAATLAGAEQLHGKELSYNNLLDLDSALNLVREFTAPAAVVLKHNNPCGAAVAETLAEAFDKAYAGDPVSAFGSILGFNREVDLPTAEALCLPDRFVEAIIAPGYSAEAFTTLTTKPKWKQNVRLLRCGDLTAARQSSWDYRRVTGGLLVQDRDELVDPEGDWQVVTTRQPTEAEWVDLRFGWGVCRHVKSNAIVFVKDGAVVGVGAGQMSRLDSAYMASYKSGSLSQGASVASDAFFPFRDGIDQAAQAGITAAIQPGGSRRDDEVIAACNEHGIAMVFTGRRHFRH